MLKYTIGRRASRATARVFMSPPPSSALGPPQHPRPRRTTLVAGGPGGGGGGLGLRLTSCRAGHGRKAAALCMSRRDTPLPEPPRWGCRAGKLDDRQWRGRGGGGGGLWAARALGSSTGWDSFIFAGCALGSTATGHWGAPVQGMGSSSPGDGIALALFRTLDVD